MIEATYYMVTGNMEESMIILTGASRGIGKYIFESFQESGTTVYGTYNTTLPIPEKEEYFTRVDITRPQEVKSWIESITDKIDHATLINCAGINYTSFAHKADINEWFKVVNVNLLGTFNVIHEVLPVMRNEGYGRIINMSSVVAQTLVPGASAYAASKAGLWGLVKSIAAENANKGITINNINLGYYNIGMIKEVPSEYQEVLKQKILTGNFGEPGNIMNAIRFLMDSDYINGTNIDMNGGLY
ncbi:SDR family NAD(P)-dependent oxidoreductase [Gemmatimonadota bacterium]